MHPPGPLMTIDQAEEIVGHPLEETAAWLGDVPDDPLAFVEGAFPWCEGELANFDGPMEWQRWVLEQIRDGLLTVGRAIQIAVASGHGIGKTALVSWITLWAMTTAGDTRGIVTASTESMLTTRLRAELRKWFRLFRGQTFFELTSTALISRDVAHEQTWRFTRPPHRGGGRTYNFATSKKGSAPFHRSSFEMRCTVPVRSRATWPPSRYPDPSQVASAPSARSHYVWPTE